MLEIRKEQMDAFSAYMAESFRERMVARISARFPRQYGAMKQQGALDLVDLGTRKCAAHGIKAERDVGTFVELMVEFGPEFEAQRERAVWAQPLLKNPNLSAQAKVDVLYVKTTGRVREG